MTGNMAELMIRYWAGRERKRHSQRRKLDQHEIVTKRVRLRQAEQEEVLNQFVPAD
jgi:hypothetical protein